MNTMAEPLIIRNTIFIEASPETVWDALVNPEKTKQYMFGCETVSTWQPGDSLEWKGSYEGKEMIFVKGEIVHIDPPRQLKYTTIDPNSNIDDTSENYLWVTYDLESEGNGTRLSVAQGDYSTVAEGERRYTDSYNNGEGWNPILTEIKKVVEG